jgi:hypothetical protein
LVFNPRPHGRYIITEIICITTKLVYTVSWLC